MFQTTRLAHPKRNRHKRGGHPMKLWSLTGAHLATMEEALDFSASHCLLQLVALAKNLKKPPIPPNVFLIPLQFGLLFSRRQAHWTLANPLSEKQSRNKAVMAMWRHLRLVQLQILGPPWVPPETKAHLSKSRLGLVPSVHPLQSDRQLLPPYVQFKIARGRQ